MENFTTARAKFATQGLVYLAIAFGVISFWDEAVRLGGAIDYVVALLLTAGFTFISFLLSGAVPRFAEAKGADQVFTQRAAIGLGFVLCLIEGSMTHQGLAWLDARKDLGDDLALWVASFGLSAFNVLGFYVFARELPKPKTKAAPAETSADVLIFGSSPAIRQPAHREPAPRLNLAEGNSLREVADRLRASGAL